MRKKLFFLANHKLQTLLWRKCYTCRLTSLKYCPGIDDYRNNVCKLIYS